MARSNESPMDFQWQQGYGPSGLDSPFLKGVVNKMSAPDERSMSKGNSPFESHLVFETQNSNRLQDHSPASIHHRNPSLLQKVLLVPGRLFPLSHLQRR